MFLNADGKLNRGHIVRQAVADGGSGDREGPAADGRQFHERHQQTIGDWSEQSGGNVCSSRAFCRNYTS